MLLDDTSKKFVEMRVSDQTFRNLDEEQFVEFFVNSHAGEIFRDRVNDQHPAYK
ncbi:hypothetical protein VrSk94_21630 [Vibrio rotiferianus]